MDGDLEEAEVGCGVLFVEGGVEEAGVDGRTVDGHVLVGSTLEHAGFDKTPTGEALASLQASAAALLPGLAQAAVVGHWAGLRPGSPEGVPYIGEVPEFPGLWLNCGHYRNGLVLAPASCALLKNLLLGEAPIVDPRPYQAQGRLGAGKA